MLDVGELSRQAHSAFEVPITVSRSGEDDRAELAVFHLGTEEWHSHSSVQRIVSLDLMSVAQTVDIDTDDVITCSDTTAVPATTTWTVADRLPSDGDRWIKTWRIVQQGDAI